MPARALQRTLVVAGAALLLAGGIYVFPPREGARPSDPVELPAAFTIPGPFPAVEPSPPDGQNAGDARYIHPNRGFSLEYPGDLLIETFDEASGGETIVFQDPAASGEKRGFQITIHPFEGAGALTRERIAADIPGMAVEEPQEVIIGDGMPALIFWSRGPEIGRTREAWFVHDGHLYAVTTYAELDGWLAGILATLRFAK